MADPARAKGVWASPDVERPERRAQNGICASTRARGPAVVAGRQWPTPLVQRVCGLRTAHDGWRGIPQSPFEGRPLGRIVLECYPMAQLRWLAG